MIGRQISHYKVLEMLGNGGMGVVYKARDLNLDRLVALKFLPPHLSMDTEGRERFIHEAKAVSALDHWKFCTIYEITKTEIDQIFIVMAYYDGETLADKIKCGSLDLEKTLCIALQIAQGLANAHKAGIVHRDIKPANIIITEEGLVKLLDFGLAKFAGESQLTQSLTTMGTAAYMSPEQSDAEPVDYRTDIWSLGVVIYEMLSGSLPFQGTCQLAVMYSVVNEKPESLTAKQALPAGLKRLISRCLEKDRDDKRYQSMYQLIAELCEIKLHASGVNTAQPTWDAAGVAHPLRGINGAHPLPGFDTAHPHSYPMPEIKNSNGKKKNRRFFYITLLVTVALSAAMVLGNSVLQLF